MDRTTDEFTPLWMPWREALKRASSFEALRPYLHLGQILARHGGLYAWPDGRLRSGPGDVRPEWWAFAYEDRAGRVIFFTDPVVSGYAVIQEHVFAYAVSIELDSVAFDAVFPVSAGPPLTEPVIADPPLAEPVIADPAPAASAAPPVNLGGRPTDRDLVLEEAGWRLRHQQVPETLAALARELHKWLGDHGKYRAVKTGEVMKAKTIEGHVRPLWNERKRT